MKQWKWLRRTIALNLFVLLPFGAVHADSTSDIPAYDVNNAEASPAMAGAGVVGVGLRVADFDRSIKYYTEGLGMKVKGKIDASTATEIMLEFDGNPDQASFIIYQSKGDQPPQANDNRSAFGRVIVSVPDLQATAAKLTAAGYEAGEIRGTGPYKILIVRDPDGYALELIQTVQSKQ